MLIPPQKSRVAMMSPSDEVAEPDPAPPEVSCTVAPATNGDDLPSDGQVRGEHHGRDLTAAKESGCPEQQPGKALIAEPKAPVADPKAQIAEPKAPAAEPKAPAKLIDIPVGDVKTRSKLRFDVVTARVIETAGKKHVSYSIIIKRATGNEPQPAVIERRYNDFCYVYESILKNFHPSILGDFMFPKKVLIGNFKAEVITERTEAFHKFLNLIGNCDNLVYSEYFYSFLCSEEHNEAVSHIKLCRYQEAIPLLENIFYVREKLLTLSHAHVLQCLCELVATLAAVSRPEMAFSYALVAMRSLDLARGHPEAEAMRVSFLKEAASLAEQLGHNSKPFKKQLSELRYKGVRLENAKPLLELIRERYIHQASHTAKLA